MLSYGCHDAYTETLAWLIYIRFLGFTKYFLKQPCMQGDM